MSPILSYSGRGRGRILQGRGGRGHHGGRFRGGGDRHSSAASSSSSVGPGKRHQWVRPKDQDKQDSVNDGVASSEQKVTDTMGGRKVLPTKHEKNNPFEKTAKEPQPMSSSSTTRNHAVMTKLGRNQLVLSNKKQAYIASNLKVDESSQNTSDSTSKQTLMLREGKNKLVAVTKKASATSSGTYTAAPKIEPLSQPPYHKGRKNPRRGQSRSSGSHTNHGPAKRIKVTVLRSDDNVSSDDDHASKDNDEGKAVDKEDGDTAVSNADKDNHPTETVLTKEEKLTDFAYVETSRVRNRPKVSRNMHWSKSNNIGDESSDQIRRASRNMGLVRVAPNEKKTPICPTYLRGLQCQDEFCRKRHDVPRDFATPVCSFFLRHGNCLRGEECVFRHVKLNPSAMVCPSFSLLGFCEDKACRMQHVRSRIGGKTQK
ncbi:zinc finger domain containing protein [Nitzschia inconspicua]|uniref:Zinc finger domain containing protein n=1 Tax=Nitzschia inconspicua TaxID=303405 RepID=A0A9K3LDB6_9STRA|nr:zinc finger domain containing protein [Nitzschia inconspicua]